MAELASKLAKINVEEADEVFGMEAVGGGESAGGKATDCGGLSTGVLAGCRVAANNGEGGLLNAGKKKVKTARKSKKVKQRTEPLWAYNCFVQEEKQAIAPRKKLDMTMVNQKWSSMTPAEKVPYVERSLEDRVLLGPHYTLSRRS